MKNKCKFTKKAEPCKPAVPDTLYPGPSKYLINKYGLENAELKQMKKFLKEFKTDVPNYYLPHEFSIR